MDEYGDYVFKDTVGQGEGVKGWVVRPSGKRVCLQTGKKWTVSSGRGRRKGVHMVDGPRRMCGVCGKRNGQGFAHRDE